MLKINFGSGNKNIKWVITICINIIGWYLWAKVYEQKWYTQNHSGKLPGPHADRGINLT